jgi:hypothetical protein
VIEVVVRNRPVGKGAVFYHEPSTVSYVGELLANPGHIANDCITMSGDGFIPYRVIPKRDIVSMGGRRVVYTPKLSTTQTWRVAGSKGNEYTVTNSDGAWSCTCTGFGFRRDCKHIQEKKNAV